MTEKFGYSIKEAIEATSFSRSQLYRLRDGGRLRFVKIGRRIVIPTCDLRALIEDRPR